MPVVKNVALHPRSSYCVNWRSKPCRCIPADTRPMPAQESSHARSAQRARSCEGRGSPAKPSAARRSWPFGSSMLLDHLGRLEEHRRWIVRPSALASPSDQLMVRAFRNVIPRTDQRLELREGRMDLLRHRRLLRFFPDDVGGELLKLAEHRRRDLENVDLVLELCLELRE